MSDPAAPDTDELLDRACQGDGAARQQLLARHRQRLRRMIALHLDRRLAARRAASGTSPREHVLSQERRQRLQEALARLGERDREVLVLRYLEQLSTKETAAVLGISDGAVKLRHLRALERLRDLLGD